MSSSIPLSDEIATIRFIFQRHNPSYVEIVLQFQLRWVYNLKLLTEQEFENIPQSEKEFVHKHRGIIHLYSEPERYVNHSDNPNTYQDLENFSDVASRDIVKGEMITTDGTQDDI